ncbi:RepB family plasmid replication initiator protein [Listeria booriae]|uniref:RepB family plasmid replication initiator protein n=1 Tax=Listeria booriae TaxID=1552123 RepID=A0A842F4A0_9LIST|nr:RepB family plasmid replication initiator protein [Listeria booriae]MBC2242233.1 RepB family plasmid replication initiator protein [Listeria booriae]
MNDIGNKKIVQHNDLITSVAKMDKMPLKFFEIAVAALNVKDIPEDRTVHISKELLFSFFDVQGDAKYTRLKQVLLKLHEQAAFHLSQQVDTNKFDMKIISPIEETRWNNYGDTVSIQFTSKILPYLIELKENFTQYLLSDIANLKNKHSIVIYKWLSMNYNQYEYYRNTSNRTLVQLEEYKNPTITIEELRRITDTEKEYARMKDFTRGVLEKAVNEISTHTNFEITYDKIKRGKAVAAIQFFITKKAAASDEFYKEEQQDPAYLEGKEQKTQLFFEATQHAYTRMLLKQGLIKAENTVDIDTMVNLMRFVYPLYDELRALGGTGAVESHLNRIKNSMEPYSKGNISNYLLTCADKWVNGGARMYYNN